jgi:hypothetical protein
MTTNKTRHGGRRAGAGRKPSLTVNEQLIAGNRCEELLHAKAAARASILQYGEEGAENLARANAALREASETFRQLSPEDRVVQREIYARKRRLLGRRWRQTIEDDAHDIKKVVAEHRAKQMKQRLGIAPTDKKEQKREPDRYVSVGAGRGRRSTRQEEAEQTRAEIIASVAVSMGLEIGRPVSRAAVRKAWEFTRALAAENPVAELILGEALLSLTKIEET